MLLLRYNIAHHVQLELQRSAQHRFRLYPEQSDLDSSIDASVGSRPLSPVSLCEGGILSDGTISPPVLIGESRTESAPASNGVSRLVSVSAQVVPVASVVQCSLAPDIALPIVPHAVTSVGQLQAVDDYSQPATTLTSGPPLCVIHLSHVPVVLPQSASRPPLAPPAALHP